MQFKNGKREVYVITHNPTGKSYVGSSKNPTVRILTHMNALRNGNHPVEDMQSDFNRYGDDYSSRIVDEFHSYDGRMIEYEWMERLKSNIRGFGYNYKDSHYTKSKSQRGAATSEYKAMLFDLLEKLTPKQIEYLYRFAASLFGLN